VNLRRTLFRVLTTVGIGLPRLAPAAGVEEAERAFTNLKYSECLAAAQTGLRMPGNDRDAVLRLLELEGFSAVALGKKAVAQSALRKLFTLDPERKLSPDVSPKLATPFLEAKAWAATHGALTAEITASSGPGELAIRLVRDPLNLARKARIYTRQPASDYERHDLAISGANTYRVPVETGGNPVEYYVELTNEHDGVLVSLGSAASPRRLAEAATSVAPTAKAPESTPPPETAPPRNDTGAVVAASGPDSDVSREAAKPIPAGWIVSGVLAAAGLVSAGVGVGVGVNAYGQYAEAKKLEAETNSQGRIIGITQVGAEQYQRRGNNEVVLSDVLWGVGAALAIAGVALFVATPRRLPVEASLAPTSSGVAFSLSGRF
jgi:hypothetical protein